ncbi:MAG: hypothetical protein EBR71_13450, partial [Planctomycetes bacterium]|nr:hypothetical protein [Planctomycetota bacterium]
TKAYNDERKGVVADEAARLDDSPVLKSLRLMKDTPLSLEWLQDRMGQDVTDLLPKRVPPIWKEGGANPDSIAEMAGFESGQQMIEVLIGAERQHRQAREGGDQRTMRARMIDQAADAEMQRRHGDDPFNDGSIEQEAIAAVNGELAGEVLATEIRLLSRKTGQRPTPYKIAREWARGKVRGGTVSEEATPGAIQRHARAVAKAGREAEKALLSGKFDEAQRFKQQQMLSSALLAEAKAALDEVQAAQARLDKIAKRKTMKRSIRPISNRRRRCSMTSTSGRARRSLWSGKASGRNGQRRARLRAMTCCGLHRSARARIGASCQSRRSSGSTRRLRK